jgi:tyrosyl-DNA phosphodiesterase 2
VISRLSGIDMIGMDAIPGLSYSNDKKVRKEIKKLELPVLPSVTGFRNKG